MARGASRVSVRTLVESVMLAGDIVPAGIGGLKRMQEGQRGHVQVQAASQATREVAVSTVVRSERIELTVQGRIDMLTLGETGACIEEIKTTHAPLARIEPDPVHWAQAECYAHIVCLDNALPQADVALIYWHVPSGDMRRFERTLAAQELEARFLALAMAYIERLEALAAWQETRDASIEAFAFPFDGYRAGQRTMAVQAYIAFREARPLLVCAPTGIGKTAAALYPALKALGAGIVSRIFYMTARTTARLSAQNALRLMRQGGLRARSVTLTAKDKLCPYPEAGCRPDACPRARGYYDRLPAALRDAGRTDAWAREDVIAFCDERELCPFEFQLDLSLQCDVIIGDYNHAFDPRVRLRRYFEGGGGAYALLVDEAHHLPDRAREMFSAQIGQRGFSELRKQIASLGRKHPLTRASRELRARIGAFGEAMERGEANGMGAGGGADAAGDMREAGCMGGEATQGGDAALGAGTSVGGAGITRAGSDGPDAAGDGADLLCADAEGRNGGTDAPSGDPNASGDDPGASDQTPAARDASHAPNDISSYPAADPNAPAADDIQWTVVESPETSPPPPSPLERPADDADAFPALPVELIDAALAFCAEAEALLDAAAPVPPALIDMLFEVRWFLWVADRLDERYRILVRRDGRHRALSLLCLDAAEEIRAALKPMRSAVFFSATLSPLPFYRDLFGLDETAGLLSLPSPFPPERFLVLAHPLPTTYAARASSLARVAQAIGTMARARVGNYLAFFPSYRYLQDVLAAFGEQGLDDGLCAFAQERGLSDAAREAFLDRFQPAPTIGHIGFAVMGSLFGEGVDLPGDRLHGVAIVGVGLPQMGDERDALRDWYDAAYGHGFAYAYQYPGMCRVLQAMGRVIRDECDAGVALLIDDRFLRRDYAALLPPHWTPRIARRAADVDRELQAFWAGIHRAGSPRP